MKITSGWICQQFLIFFVLLDWLVFPKNFGWLVNDLQREKSERLLNENNIRLDFSTIFDWLVFPTIFGWLVKNQQREKGESLLNENNIKLDFSNL